MSREIESPMPSTPSSPHSAGSNFSFSKRLKKVTSRLKIASALSPSHKKRVKVTSDGWFDAPSVVTVEQSTTPKQMMAAAKHRTPLYILSRRIIIHNLFQFLSFVMTMLALFLDPIRDAWMDKGHDEWVNAVLFVCFMFFCVEMTLLSIAEKGYFNSFFFWLDFLGSVSLIFDIPWLVKVVVPEELGILPLLRGAKAARAGARATRLVRLVRLIRLVRFIKVLSFFNGSSSHMAEDEDGNEEEQVKNKPSRVGEILSEQISRRVVVLVLLVLFVAPQLSVTTDNITSQQILLKALLAMPEETRSDFIYDQYITHTGSFKKVLYLEVDGIVYVEEPKRGIKTSFRPEEVFSLGIKPSNNLKHKLNSGEVFEGCGQHSKDANCTLVKFDDSFIAQEDGKMSCLLIVFMIFLLSFGSYLFTVIAKKLAVAPIERMLAVIDIVSESLHALKRDGDRFSKEDKDRTLEEELGDADEPEADYEISFLEEAVLKMAELLHMGYGAAGTEIIQRNLGLSDGTAVETFIAGTKLNAVFAFCDIRKFTDTTEILQENVLRFVNLVGHVVHSNTEWYEGSPNKNIGDAFLLVWKMTKMAQKRMNVQRLAAGSSQSNIFSPYDSKSLSGRSEGPTSPSPSTVVSPSLDSSLGPGVVSPSLDSSLGPGVVSPSLDSSSIHHNIGTWAAPESPAPYIDDDEAFSMLRPSTRQRGDMSSLAPRLAPGVVEMMPKSTHNLFPEFGSERDESTAITLADGCLKAMVQTAFDLYHLNTIPEKQLLDQVIALDTVKDERPSATKKLNKAQSVKIPVKRRSNAWGRWMQSTGMGPRKSKVGVDNSNRAQPSARVQLELEMGEEKDNDDDDIEASSAPEDILQAKGMLGLAMSVGEAAFQLKKAEFASRIVETLIKAGRHVALGYGMHFGWAIEGAIGSNLKIDASYLSPHVNTAARLEAATKQFGTMFLMSEEFVQQLSPRNQALSRRIDNVILVGKSDPTPLFTWDMWLGPPKRQGPMECHPLSPLHVLNSAAQANTATSELTMVMPAAHLSPEMAPKMFVDMFSMGYRAYQVGSWDMSAKTLRRCLEIVPDDGPTLSLLAVMKKADFKAPTGWAGFRHLTDK
jgi:class 3 adenylate cyclase